jgi:succinoglycan biosynthesis transport protein ExoP
VRNIRGAVERDLAAVTQQEQGLSKLFVKAKGQALDLNLLEIEYNRLRRTKDNVEKLYGVVLERTKESDLARMMRVNNIRVIDRPLIPGSPIRPRVLVNIAFGIVLGLGLGLAAALGRAVLDRTLKTPDDVEHELGIPFLGLLPVFGGPSQSPRYGRKKKSRRQAQPVVVPELVVHEHPTSGIAEASRAIRTNLLFMSPDKPYKTLLVTSAGPAEGKTTVACCIAVALAQAGQRVALVDCDLRRPRLHRIFHRPSDVGVTTMLLEGTATDAFPTEVPNLSVLPSGPIPPNPAELFHSDRFRHFLDELSARYDRVIIDSPPVVAVTDATVLSTIVDRTVLVIRAFGTTKDLARHGIRSLADVGGKTVGVVLNAVDLEKYEYKYYTYYYAKEGYYLPNEDRAEDAKASSAHLNG